LPVVRPGGSPYVRRIPVGPNVTGRYSVTTRKAGMGLVPGAGAVPGFEEYELVSVGSVTDLADGGARVVARVRYGPDPAGPRARILKWEESGPR